MKKNISIRFFLTLSIILSCFFIFSFTQAVYSVLSKSDNSSESLKNPTTDDGVTASDNKELIMVGLGDSITRGVGDSSGKGYLMQTKENLEKALSQKIGAINLAVSGAKSDELLTSLEEAGVRTTIATADIICMTIGANDLSPGASNISEEVLANYKPNTEQFIKNSTKILTTIQEINPDAVIYWVSLYNPFEDIPELVMSSNLVLQWNHIVEEIASEFLSVKVVPVYELFQGKVDKYLYSDHYHPSTQGHKKIAERLSASILNDFLLEE